MLIRITQKSSGIEHYFSTAEMKGREETREELDTREFISGDLNTFSMATKYTRDNKKWKNHYWHITASFALENNDISNDKIQAIHKELLEYYFCNNDPEKIIHAAEVHRPKLQSMVDQSTGEENQRLLHFHSAISKYDIDTGNQIRMIPFNHKADRAFQSYLCAKYNLVDPVTRSREKPVTKKELIARYKGDLDSNKTKAKQTKVSELRKLFSELLKDVKSIDEAVDIINDTGLAKKVTFKDFKRSGNKYLQVAPIDGGDNINIRGRGFEALEKLYYTDKELAKRIDDGKYGKYKGSDTASNIKANKKIYESHRDWWLKEERERIGKKPEPKIDYKKIDSKYEKQFKPYTKEQRLFFVIYKNNIQEELINGYKIWSKANERFLVNKSKDIKIYDRPDKISLEIPNDQEKRKEAVKVALEIAQSKGWNLDTIRISGSFEFQQEVKKQIDEINNYKSIKNTISSSIPNTKSIQNKKNIKKIVSPSPVDDSLKSLNQDRVAKLSKDEIAAIKTGLNAESVLDYAVSKYKLISEHFEVTSDNKINDKRTRAKPKNVIDFITKTCNIPLSEALPELQQLYDAQLSLENIRDMKLSVCTSSNPNGINGWQVRQPKTFNELASIVKSHSYASFTGLKDDHRKASNVVELGNVAIFDIDNDPDTPNLSIEQCQELLKDTTYLLVTSKSHGKEKDDKPAVDRYRLLVPIQEPLSTNRDEYRLSSVMLAEQLGIIDYVDNKALKDIARQYYPSPTDAITLKNNTKSAFDTSKINALAKEQMLAMAEHKEQLRLKVSKSSTTMEFKNSNDYPKSIDVDALNSLPLPAIYESITGNKLHEDGSYLKGRGITAGTSQSRESFTVFQADNQQWLWHDFKSNESGNVLSFMKHAGMDVYKAAEALEKQFNVALITDNAEYYAEILRSALKTAINDKTLEAAIKAETGATYVKLGKNDITISDKTFSLEDDLKTSKLAIINQLRANRGNQSTPQQGPKF